MSGPEPTARPLSGGSLGVFRQLSRLVATLRVARPLSADADQTENRSNDRDQDQSDDEHRPEGVLGRRRRIRQHGEPTESRHGQTSGSGATAAVASGRRSPVWDPPLGVGGMLGGKFGAEVGGVGGVREVD